MIERIGAEGLKAVENPGIIDPKDFIKEVIENRISNANIPDAPQRMARQIRHKKWGFGLGKPSKNMKHPLKWKSQI